MNKIKLLLTTLLCSTSVAFAQEEIMTVYTTDGKATVYKVAQIDRVEFGVSEPLVLKNQYAIGNDVADIAKVEELNAHDGKLVYNVYGASAKMALQIEISETSVGKAIDLSADTDNNCQIVCKGNPMSGEAIGSLKISKDKFGKNVTIALDAKWGEQQLQVAYTGTYEKDYVASNTYSVSTESDSETDQKIRTVLMQTDATGGATTFVLSNVDTTEPTELAEGSYAIWFALSAAKLNKGEIVLEENINSYTLRLLDYTSGKVIEANDKTTGVITTYAAPDGDENKIFFRIEAQLTADIHIEAEFWGNTTSTDNIEAAIPVPEKVNSFTITAPNGDVSSYAEVETIQVQEKGEMTYFYFMKKATDNPNDQFLTPMVAIKTSLINSGEIDLPTAEPNTWAVSYQALQLTSPDNEWMNKATNGTLSVSKEGDIYSIDLQIIDSYYTPWNTTSVAGSMDELTIYYVGTASAYSGR